jgi:acid phosphatase type 7
MNTFTTRLMCVLALLATTAGCGGSSSSTSPGPTEITPVDEYAELVGAGDIGDCSADGPESTAQLLDGYTGAIFTAGDNTQGSGTALEFLDCFGPTWGRHLSQIRPVPGNHEYFTTNAGPYFNYFGSNAGPSGLGYYNYTLGRWQIIALNSNLAMTAGSTQEQWLRGVLAATGAPCTLVYFHHPLIAPEYSASRIAAVWRALYQFKADVVINGHHHFYERFTPQNGDGVADPARGFRQFIVGTGGGALSSPSTADAISEVRNNDTWGVLKLTLHFQSYDWQFIPVKGQSFTDSGSADCVK